MRDTELPRQESCPLAMPERGPFLQDKNLLTYVKPEDRYRWRLGDSQNSFLLDNVCLEAEVSASRHFETECHFLVTSLLFICVLAELVLSPASSLCPLHSLS